VLLATVVVVMPWTIRNAARLHAFVPVTTSSGFGLVGTYNDTSRTNTKNPAQWIEPYADPTTARVLNAIKDPTEVKVDQAGRKASIDVVRGHPTYPLQVAFWNTERLFDFDRGHYSLSVVVRYLPYPRGLTRLAVYSSYLVVLLAVIGGFFRAARRMPAALWLIPVLTWLFLVFFLPANIRYRASIEPYFVFLACIPISWAVDRILRSRSESGSARGLPLRTGG
jgi:hypothetical protein